MFGAVLAAFAHRLSGAAAAERVLRGLLIGLFGFTGFFLLLTLTIGPLGIVVSFAAATALAVAIQGGSLWALRRLRPEVTPLRR
jgi:site-specific recombinase